MSPAMRPVLLALGISLLIGCSGTPPAPTPGAPTEAPTPGITPASATQTPEPTAPTPRPATPTPEPPTPTPDGEEALAIEGRIINREHGYAVTLPDGWLRMDLDEEFMELFAQELGSDAAEELVDMFGDQLQAMIASGMSLIAFRAAELLEAEFATNVNVLSVPSGGMSLDMLERLNRGQIEQLPGFSGGISTERVQLPAGEALYLSYSLVEGTTRGETHQYLYLAGGKQHWLTVSGLAGDAILADEAHQMAESFEFLDN